MHKILIENITKMCQFPNGITLCILHITQTFQYMYTGRLFFQYAVSTVGPQLSGHQLSGYLYYPATILQCKLSIFH